MCTIMSTHAYVQKHIPDLLRSGAVLRYSQLQPKGVESSRFKYHFNQLLKDSLVTQESRGKYILTTKTYMFENLIIQRDIIFVVNLLLSLACGLLIGTERELKGRPTGRGTQTLVIAGAMLFAFISKSIPDSDPTRIAAQIVTGVGFLGAGIILKTENESKISNLTTAASIWYGAAIGTAIGFEMYLIAVAAALYATLINRIPHVK